MIRKFLCLFFTAFIIACTSTPAPKSMERYVSVNELVSDTVVVVLRDTNGNPEASCTGVWIGLHKILAAAHCTEADQLTYGTAVEKVPLHATLVTKIDKLHDLAMLEAGADAPPHTIAAIADASPVIGDPIFVMGHPLRFTYSYSQGFVSAYRQNMRGPCIKSHSLDFGAFVIPICDDWIRGNFVQISAPVTHGNSGSAVFDRDGNVIGILSFVATDSGTIGFASDLDQVKDFLK